MRSELRCARDSAVRERVLGHHQQVSWKGKSDGVYWWLYNMKAELISSLTVVKMTKMMVMIMLMRNNVLCNDGGGVDG